jgi:uncharacterized membrane protein YfcA
MDYNLIILVVIGIIAGFINTLAGGGSLIALPFLIFLGLPANIANGTLRIGIFLQSLVGVSDFRHQKVFTFKEGIWLAVPATVGSIIGSKIAVDINQQIMEYIIGGLLIFMFVFMLFKPEIWQKSKSVNIKDKPTFIQIIILFPVGFYGGFIQAGVGFFLLAALVLGVGLDLVKANAVKVFIILIYTIFALGVFILEDLVNYKYGLILAIGNMIGAFIATRFAVNWGPKFIRIILLIVLFGASLEIFGVYKYLVNIIF